MPQRSAGILMWNRKDGALWVLLVHPGGPFWTRKNAGAWTIPKGECDADEEPLAAAQREFLEELGCDLAGRPAAAFTPRSSLRTLLDSAGARVKRVFGG